MNTPVLASRMYSNISMNESVPYDIELQPPVKAGKYKVSAFVNIGWCYKTSKTREWLRQNDYITFNDHIVNLTGDKVYKQDLDLIRYQHLKPAEIIPGEYLFQYVEMGDSQFFILFSSSNKMCKCTLGITMLECCVTFKVWLYEITCIFSQIRNCTSILHCAGAFPEFFRGKSTWRISRSQIKDLMETRRMPFTVSKYLFYLKTRNAVKFMIPFKDNTITVSF